MGAPLYDFHPGRWKRWLVVALGVVTFGVFISVLMASRKAVDLPSVVGLLEWPTLLLFLAFLFFGNTRVLITSSEVISIRGGLLVFFFGLWKRNLRKRKRESCRWDDVTEVVMTSEVVVTDYRGREIRTTYTFCRLVRKDGSRLELREAERADIEPVLAALRREAAARGIPWRQ